MWTGALKPFVASECDCRGYEDVVQGGLAVWLAEDTEGVGVRHFLPYTYITLGIGLGPLKPFKKRFRVEPRSSGRRFNMLSNRRGGLVACGKCQFVKRRVECLERSLNIEARLRFTQVSSYDDTHIVGRNSHEVIVMIAEA